MKGIGKNLRFYCETLLMSALKTIALVVVMSVLMIFMEGGNYKEAASRIVPLYLVIVAVLLNFAGAMNSFMVLIPLTVSLGSTRKNSFWGMIVAEHLFDTVLLVVIYSCYYFLFYDLFSSFWMPYALSIIGSFVIMISLGNLIGVIIMVFGKTMGIVVYLVLILGAMFGAICFVMTGVFEGTILTGTLENISSGPWILLLGIVIDVVIGWLSYNAIRKRDMQFG